MEMQMEMEIYKHAKVRERLDLPKAMAETLEKSSQELDRLLQEYNASYEGTDPVGDAQRVFRQQQKRRLRGGVDRIYLEDLLSLGGARSLLFEEDTAADPFETFGYGVLSFFSTLRGLIIAMAVMTLLFGPVTWMYTHEHFLTDSDELGFGTTQFSLGNLGQTGA